MIRRLRYRFILVATAALVIAVSLTLSAVLLLSSRRIDIQYGAVLEAILENGGRLPGRLPDDERIDVDEIPELLYELRFFSVVVDGDGNVSGRDTGHIATVDRQTADRAVGTAVRTGRPEGRVRAERFYFNYASRQTEEGRLYVFIDVSSRAWILREITSYMWIVGLCIAAIFLLIIFFYSREVIAPYVESMEKQQQFITNASHELKTPLAVISANTEMTEKLSGETRWTRSTLKQVERLNGLVARLVTLARMREKKPEDLMPVDMSRVASEEADDFEDVVTVSGKRFSKSVEMGVTVKGDEKSLRELCAILLDNAAKYCDEGGCVSISLAGGRHPALTVSNTYAGEGKVDTSRFFERFYRQDGSHNSQKQGYGIGLSIARDIAFHMEANLRCTFRGGVISFAVTMKRDGPGSGGANPHSDAADKV